MVSPPVSEIRAQFGRPFAEQVAFFRSLLAVSPGEWRRLDEAARRHAFYVSGAFALDLVADILAALAQAIEQGRSIAWFRAEFDRIVAERGWGARDPRLEDAGYRDWRAMIVFTTVTQRTYSEGRLVQLRDPELRAVAPIWVYRHSELSVNPRPWHLAWNGQALSADDPWWALHYPPRGFNCRCYVVAMSEATARARGYRFTRPPGEHERVTHTDQQGNRETLPAGVDPGWGHRVDTSARASSGLEASVSEARQALADKLTALRARGLGDLAEAMRRRLRQGGFLL